MSDTLAINKVADHYRRMGYEVLVRPKGADVPPFLGEFRPDLIARSDNKTIVVEVRNRRDLAGDLELGLVADAIAAQPGWSLDIVGDGEEPTWPDRVANSEEPTLAAISKMIESSRRLNALGERQAACLVGWAAIEASMRAVATQNAVALDNKDPALVLKTLYSQGLLSRQDYSALDRTMEIRNTLAHGLDPIALTDETVKILLESATHLLAMVSRTAA